MGFDPEAARAALQHFNADLPKAINELLQLSGVVPPEWLREVASSSGSSSATSSSSGIK